MATKNKITLILSLLLLLATPSFANSYGLDTVAKVESERCVVRFNVSPAGTQATVMYKSTLPDAVEKLFGTVNENGSVAGFVDLGEYDYKVVAQGCITVEGRLLLNKANSVVVENVTLRSKLANITLKAKGNDIYVNGEKVGADEWNSALAAGSYTVECRKENHRSTVQVIEVFEGCDEVLQLAPAVPIVGGLLVFTDPLDAKVLVDGVDYGLSPVSIDNLFVGDHEVVISKVGYIDMVLDVVIEENVMCEQIVALVKATYADAKLAYDKGDYSKAVEILAKLVEENDVEAQYLLATCHLNGQGVEQSFETAVEWLRKAAEQGHAEAQCMLGGYYYSGNGVQQSYETAVEWYRKAAEQGVVEAQSMLGDCYYNGNGIQQSSETAVEWYGKAAEQGNVKAQSMLGFCHYYGNGAQQSYEGAVEWYRKAADQGDVMAQSMLGFCHYHGNGVQQSYESALEWYRKAAEQGDAKAQSMLGVCYYNGNGVQQSYKTAVEWYSKAAEQGVAEAQSNLGICYYYGNGAQKSHETAVAWWSKAAEHGLTDAQYNLGTCYYNGNGVLQSYETAVAWWSKAAEQGSHAAQYNLGACYYNGNGVQQSYETAVEWWNKAAGRGNATALYMLGACHENGKGVAKSLDEALAFYRKAVEQGYSGAGKDVERVSELIDSLRIYDVVDENPEFPGGMNSVARYLLDNVKYPDVSRDNNSQGKALVQFVVNADGSIQDVEINRSTGDVYLDKEAIRVVEAMPNWKPGKHRGKVVRVRYVLQVNFRLRQ